MKLEYYNTVEPHNDGLRDPQNMFAVTRFCYIEVLIHIFCFGWGKESHLLYRGHHYKEVNLIETPL